MNAFSCPAISPISPHPLAAPSRYLGRQPVVDAHRSLFGYRLQLGPHHTPGDADGHGDDTELAIRQMLDHWLMLIPEHLERSTFVLCTRTALVEGLVTLLPPASTVLGIPAEISPEAELISCCQDLLHQGYRFSLEGFAPNDPRAALLDIADFVQFDFPASDYVSRQEIYLSTGGRPQLLAGKVETEVQMRLLRGEGCSLFQGQFYAQPVLSRSAAVPKSYLIYLKLLSALDADPADLRLVEKLVSGDASLCYRVLRLANSALQGHAGEVSTVREALLMVGDDAVRRMATVAVAGALSGQRSAAVLELALSRARFCELLAPSIAEDAAQMYLLGIVSTLEALLEAPLHRILESLPLRDTMKAALAGGDSPSGRALELVRSLEACDWEQCQKLQYRLGLPENAIAAAHVEALRWASASIASLGAPESRQ